MPEAEKRKTDPNAAYGEQKAQQDFMAATSPVATPQIAQNEPVAFSPIEPRAFAPEASQPVQAAEVLVPGRDLDPEEAQALFSGGPDIPLEGLESLRDWWPAIAAIGNMPDAPPYFRVLADAAERLMDEDEEFE